MALTKQRLNIFGREINISYSLQGNIIDIAPLACQDLCDSKWNVDRRIHLRPHCPSKSLKNTDDSEFTFPDTDTIAKRI